MSTSDARNGVHSSSAALRPRGRSREAGSAPRLSAGRQERTLLLRGEPGIGKTALLGCAVERAHGMLVLEARGLEVEAQLAFSGLSDLVAATLLDEALALAHGASIRTEVQHLRVRIDMWRGRFADACDLLAAEATAVAGRDPESAAFMLVDAAVAADASGAVGRAVELSRKAWGLARPIGGDAAAAARTLLGGTLDAHGEALTKEERHLVVDAAAAHWRS